MPYIFTSRRRTYKRIEKWKKYTHINVTFCYLITSLWTNARQWYAWQETMDKEPVHSMFEEYLPSSIKVDIFLIVSLLPQPAHLCFTWDILTLYSHINFRIIYFVREANFIDKYFTVNITRTQFYQDLKSIKFYYWILFISLFLSKNTRIKQFFSSICDKYHFFTSNNIINVNQSNIIVIETYK